MEVYGRLCRRERARCTARGREKAGRSVAVLTLMTRRLDCSTVARRVKMRALGAWVLRTLPGDRITGIIGTLPGGIKNCGSPNLAIISRKFGTVDQAWYCAGSV